MFNTRRDLSTRADRVRLEGAREPVWKDVLISEGDTDAWRIVEVSSFDGKPFDIELIWSAANGSGANGSSPSRTPPASACSPGPSRCA